MAGINVDLARQEAAKVGLSLEEAGLLVDEARRAAGEAGLADQYANLGVERARYDVTGANLPPAAGMEQWTDPYTGRSEWVTPYEADRRNAEYRKQFAEKEEEKTKRELQNLSPEALLDLMIMKQVSEQEVIEVLIAKGFTQREAELLVARARAKAQGGTTDEQRAAIAAAFGLSGATAARRPAPGGGGEFIAP